MTKPKTTTLVYNVKNQLVMKSIMLTLLLYTFSILTSWGQSGKLFNTDNQLSSNLVTQVYQDTNGFIWIITRNGINVYDGYNFTVFKKSASSDKGLNTNYINCITQDKQGYVILGTNKGLLRYDGQQFHNIILPDDKGKTITTYVTSICSLRNGDLAVGTSGYGMFRLKPGGNKCQRVKGTAITLKHISRITQDQQGNLWVITENGKLYKMDGKGNILTHIAGTNGLAAQEIKEDSKGTLYLATNGQGLHMKAARSTVFTKIKGISNQPIYTLSISRNGNVFLGYDGEGVTVYNPMTGATTPNPFFSAQTNIAKSKVQNIIEDTQGNMWISMLQKGVYMKPQEPYDFGYMGYKLGNRNIIGDNCVTSVYLDHQRNLWVGTDKDGLYKLSQDGKTLLTHYLAGGTILSLCEDQNGRIWAGSYTEGVGYIDAAGFHKVEIAGMGNAGVFDIKCDRQGTLWLATMGAGLVRIGANGAPIIYKVKGDAGNNPKINSIPNDYIAKLAFSKDQQRIYVATSIGLACYDLRTNNWLTLQGGINCIGKDSFSHCIFVDSKDRIWYGTEDGVMCFDNKGKHIYTYTEADGLTVNSIASITEDCKGKIWIGTTGGLNKLDVEKKRITKFYVENGVQSDEFSDGAVCTSPDKRIIIMGGTGGFNFFDATRVKQHPWQATVKISGFLVGNKKVVPGMESGLYDITKDWVYDSKQFDLAHDDNSFTLQLSTLTYSNTEQISYAYSINGEDWRQVQPGQNELSFSHLPAGSYHFRVKGICNGYETPLLEFTITIHPVWYASFWARLIYLLLFIALVVLYMRHRKRKEEDRLLLQKHIHAEEMGEAKIKFFMNISHEIRTPLTLILTPLLSLIKEDKDPHRQGIYDIMRKNSERILHLINQMMDLRKIDKGQMVMHMSETDMVAFVGDEYELFQQQALAKNIDFQFVHDSNKLPVWIDHNNFDKVLMNVLSNAFKFTPSGGKIRISLRHTAHHAYICIKDNGMGIPKDKLETIFQRFYQSPTSSTDRNIGTGIGLDLTRSLVELHYGSISAHNNESGDDTDFKKGSEFVISLPLGNEHLKPEEMLIEPKEKPQQDKEQMEELEEEMEELKEGMTEQEENTVGSLEQEEEQEDALEPQKSLLRKSRKNTIAIVEDDEDIQDYLKAQLSNDFKIIDFPNGKVALDEIKRLQPDLVISDIMMPEMDGKTLCTKLKTNVNTNHIPVILLTAMSREEDQLSGLQTGADAYLVKPFNMEILRRTIINLLSVRRTMRNKFEGKEDLAGHVDNTADSKVESPDDIMMKRVMKIIINNLDDSDLSVDMIAKQVGISRVHLHRKMKELTNQTPHSYIRNVRLKQAAKMLSESKQSVTEVMYTCGFSNAASFSTMFKNLYGCSPRDYMLNQHKK